MAGRSLESLRAERERNGKLLKHYREQEKILMRQVKELDRKKRSHRLIERGAILEKFLKSPLLITNEQITEILKVAFSDGRTERLLNEYIRIAEAGAALGIAGRTDSRKGVQGD